MTEANLDTVKTFLAARRANDKAAIAPCLADDVSLRTPKDSIPGKDNLLSFFDSHPVTGDWDELFIEEGCVRRNGSMRVAFKTVKLQMSFFFNEEGLINKLETVRK